MRLFRASRASLLTLLTAGSALSQLSCSAVVAGYEIYQCAPFSGPLDATRADAGAVSDRIASCQALNQRDGLDALSCEIWTCDQATRFCVLRPRDVDGDGALAAPPASCTYEVGPVGADCDDRDPARRPGATEACDGRDNDCDLLIDENVTMDLATVGTPTAPLDPGGASQIRVAFPSSRSSTARVALISRPSSVREAAWLDLASPGGLSSARWRFDCGGADLQDGCPAALGACTPTACEFRSPTIDLGGGTLWAAATNTVGACVEGEVRLGERRGDDLLIYNVGAAQTAYPGCEVGAILGDSHLAVGASGARAFVASVRRGPEMGSCPGAGATLRGQVVGLNPSNFIVPQATADLGPTHGAADFAVQAIADDVWIAAIPGPTGGVRVVRVDGAGTVVGLGTVEDDTVASVSLAVGRDGPRTYVGLLYASACGAGPLRFASLSFDAGNPSDVRATVPVEIATRSSVHSLHWTDVPLAIPDLARAGVVVEESSDSGWVVVWSDDRTRAQRVLAADGASLGTSAVLLESPSDFLWTSPEDGDRPTFIAALDAAARLTTIRAFCAPTAP